MKSIFILLFATFFLPSFSQEQFGNVFASTNSNEAIQIIQTNVLSNASNLNYDNNPIEQQQFNFEDNVSNIAQTSNLSKSANNTINSRVGNKMSLTLDFSSRSSSSSSFSSSKKIHKHTFHKKLTKFNRNLYGKITLHKKSKHLVDVCFNWSK